MKKLTPIVRDLAADFRRWGKEATRRVLRGVKRWGVQFDLYVDDSTKNAVG